MSGQGRLPRGDGGPHVFVDSLDSPVLADDDLHHLQRVLRTRDGDPITISDGAGRWREARFGQAPEPTSEIVVVDAATPRISVGFVVPKGDRPSWVVQKLTELGVDRILLLSSARSVVRWEGPKNDDRLSRLRSVARAAAMQSRQVRLPVIEPPLNVRSALAGNDVALAHPAGEPPSLRRSTILVGPEGGWDSAELSAGAATVGLGPSVLRAETAAIAAGTVLSLLRARLVIEHSA